MEKKQITKLVCISLALLLIVSVLLLMATGSMQDAVDECFEIFGNESMTCKTALSDPHASLGFSLIENYKQFNSERQKCIDQCSEINKEKGVTICVC